jgi:hypothetical protein
MRTKLAPTLLPLAACLYALCPLGVRADEPNPYYIGASETLTHESNLFRTPDPLPRVSDTISSTALFGGIDQPFGRQHFVGNALASYNNFSNNSVYDNTGYGLDLNLDWAALDKLGGNLNYATRRTLARFNQNNVDLIPTSRIYETGQTMGLRVQYGQYGLLSIEGAANHQTLDYSSNSDNDPAAVQYKEQNLRQTNVSLGLKYRPSGLLTLGIAGRHTSGSYPDAVINGVQGPDDFKRDDADLSATWVPTGISTVNARLSFSHESHEVLSQRDFRGVTGSISWDWRPSGRLTLRTLLLHDTGGEVTFASLVPNAPLTTVGDSSRTTTSLQIGANYEASAKIMVNASLREDWRTLVDISGASTATDNDRSTLATLGAQYLPTRNVTLGCNVSFEHRTTNSNATQTSPYSNDIFSCLARFTLQ